MSENNGDSLKKSVAIDVGVGAKANVSTEIPSESSGRLLDALTDIIRPFSERRGLIADQIRLQREDVAIEIARRASMKLQIQGQAIKPVPTKFLVNLIESSSLEDQANDDVLEIWSNLLANASEEYSNNHYFALRMLKEMSPSEAAFFDQVFARLSSLHPDEFGERTLETFRRRSPFILPNTFSDRLIELIDKKKPREEWSDEMQKHLNRSVILLTKLDICGPSKKNEEGVFSGAMPWASKLSKPDFEHTEEILSLIDGLAALGLLEHRRYGDLPVVHDEVDLYIIEVEAFYLTRAAGHLYTATHRGHYQG